MKCRAGVPKLLWLGANWGLRLELEGQALLYLCSTCILIAWHGIECHSIHADLHFIYNIIIKPNWWKLTEIKLDVITEIYRQSTTNYQGWFGKCFLTPALWLYCVAIQARSTYPRHRKLQASTAGGLGAHCKRPNWIQVGVPKPKKLVAFGCLKNNFSTHWSARRDAIFYPTIHVTRAENCT